MAAFQSYYKLELFLTQQALDWSALHLAIAIDHRFLELLSALQREELMLNDMKKVEIDEF